MFVRIEQSEAEKLALVLDSVEADLVGLQHRVFRVREALQKKAGKPCGYQYQEPNERGGAKDDTAADLLAALKEVERHCPCGARPESPRTHPHVDGCPVGEAIAKAEGKAVTL